MTTHVVPVYTVIINIYIFLTVFSNKSSKIGFTIFKLFVDYLSISLRRAKTIELSRCVLLRMKSVKHPLKSEAHICRSWNTNAQVSDIMWGQLFRLNAHKSSDQGDVCVYRAAPVGIGALYLSRLFQHLFSSCNHNLYWLLDSVNQCVGVSSSVCRTNRGFQSSSKIWYTLISFDFCVPFAILRSLHRTACSKLNLSNKMPIESVSLYFGTIAPQLAPSPYVISQSVRNHNGLKSLTWRRGWGLHRSKLVYLYYWNIYL